MKYSEEEKRMWVAEWQSSGESVWVYAKKNGLTPQTLKSWREKEGNTGELVEIKHPIAYSMLCVREIVIEKGELKVHVPVEIEIEWLRKLCGALEARA